MTPERIKPEELMAGIEVIKRAIHNNWMHFSFESPKWIQDMSIKKKLDLENAVNALEKISSMQEELDKLKAFKDYVHKRLDDMGVEKDPESTHKEKGCRIGGRLDIIQQIMNKHGVTTKNQEPW